MYKAKPKDLWITKGDSVQFSLFSDQLDMAIDLIKGYGFDYIVKNYVSSCDLTTNINGISLTFDSLYQLKHVLYRYELGKPLNNLHLIF